MACHETYKLDRTHIFQAQSIDTDSSSCTSHFGLDSITRTYGSPTSEYSIPAARGGLQPFSLQHLHDVLGRLLLLPIQQLTKATINQSIQLSNSTLLNTFSIGTRCGVASVLRSSNDQLQDESLTSGMISMHGPYLIHSICTC